MAVQVAALKVAKLIVLTLLAIFLTIPVQTLKMRQAWAKFEVRSRSAAPFGSSMGTQVTQTTAVYTTVMAVGFGIGGMLYPALSLWLLNKRSVAAALITPMRGRSRRDAGIEASGLS